MKPVVCRVKRTLWWMVLLGAGEAAFLFSAPFLPDSSNPGQRLWPMALLSWPMALLFSGFLVWMIAELVRAEIRADDEGLTWRRGFERSKSARWDEVSDFYLQNLGVPATHIAETPSGKLELSRSFENIEHIAKLLPSRALNAPSRSWEAKRFRSRGGWSLDLSLWSKGQIGFPLFMTLGPLYVVGFIVWNLVWGPRGAAPFHPLDPYQIAAGLMALPLGLLVGAAMIWAPFSAWRDYRFARRHRDERLHLDAHGLKFSSPQTSLEASWTQVKQASRVETKEWPPRFRVETDNGDFVLWHLQGSTTMWRRFRRVCEQYAPKALEAMEQSERERMQRELDLEGERGAWNSGEVGVGARVFSFRSRETRFAFGCVSALLALAPGFYLLSVFNRPVDDSPFAPSWPFFGALCAIVFLLISAMWLWFRRARILADDQGIEFHSPFRPQRLVAWNEIEECGRDAWGDFVRTPSRKIYFARLLRPVRFDELRAMLERRGPNV